jgi:pyruvate/2-oxoglutarate/acetoin dehydrogenase E1 component
VSITATPGVGIGAAMVGLRPVVEITMVNLVMLALDQIVSRRGAPCLLPNGS